MSFTGVITDVSYVERPPNPLEKQQRPKRTTVQEWTITCEDGKSAKTKNARFAGKARAFMECGAVARVIRGGKEGIVEGVQFVALSAVDPEAVEAYIRALNWSVDAPDIWKTIAAGNIRGFAAFVRREQPSGRNGDVEAERSDWERDARFSAESKDRGDWVDAGGVGTVAGDKITFIPAKGGSHVFITRPLQHDPLTLLELARQLRPAHILVPAEDGVSSVDVCGKCGDRWPCDAERLIYSIEMDATESPQASAPVEQEAPPTVDMMAALKKGLAAP